MSYSDSFRTLWNEAKNYLELQKEYLKLDTAEKLSVLLSAALTTILCLIFALAALLFLVVALALWLANIVGSAWSFAIMGGAMLLVIVIILVARKRWIVQPVTRFIAKLIVDESIGKEETP